MKKCPLCGGTGKISVYSHEGTTKIKTIMPPPSEVTAFTVQCPQCLGLGEIKEK